MFQKYFLVCILMIALFNVILADLNNIDCRNIECDEDDIGAVCGFSVLEACFQKFPSKCGMKKFACASRTEFSVFHDEYCTLKNFLCSNVLT